MTTKKEEEKLEPVKVEWEGLEDRMVKLTIFLLSSQTCS